MQANTTGNSMPFHNFVNDHIINAHHPIVCQDAEGGEASDGQEAGLLSSFDSIIKYGEYATLFAWEVQAATIGQVSGNLTICQNNSLTVYNNSIVIYDLYMAYEFDQAGNATYRVLYSVD